MLLIGASYYQTSKKKKKEVDTKEEEKGNLWRDYYLRRGARRYEEAGLRLHFECLAGTGWDGFQEGRIIDNLNFF